LENEFNLIRNLLEFDHLIVRFRLLLNFPLYVNEFSFVIVDYISVDYEEDLLIRLHREYDQDHHGDLYL